MKLNELIENVQQWSIDRGLDKADSKKQLLKLYEEFGELASGIAKNQPNVIMDSIGDCAVVLIILAQQQGLFILDYGESESKEDMIFTAFTMISSLSLRIHFVDCYDKLDTRQLIKNLITTFDKIAAENDVKFEDCLEMAWNAIKDRKGKLVDGVWVKEEDLQMKEKTYEEVLAISQSPEQTLDDVVMRPNHYRGSDGLEALEVLRQFAPDSKAMEHAYWFNAGKYFLRHPKKNGAQDIEKCLRNMVWYSSCLSGKAKTAKLLGEMKEELEK